MKKWMVRLGLSLIITIGICTHHLPAQAPLSPNVPFTPNMPYGPYPHPLPVYPPQVFVAPAVPYEPALHPPYPLALGPRDQPPLADHFLQRMWNQHGLGCQANGDGSCGNLYSECRFIFGSCRSFFGDACVPCTMNRHGR